MLNTKKNLAIIFFIVLIDIIGFGIIIPLLPYLVSSLGKNAFAIGILMAIYPFMQFLFSPVWGKLSDKYGRRPFLLLSLLGSILAHTLFAFSSTYTFLFIARALAGFFGASISSATAYVADISKPEDRTKRMGFIGAAFGLGFVLGPALGGAFGVLGQHLGQAPPFGQQFAALMAGVICLFNFIFAFFFLEESLVNLKKTEKFRIKDIWHNTKLLVIIDALKLPIIGKFLIMGWLFSLAMVHMEVSLFLLMKERFDWSLLQSSLGFAYIGLIMAISQGGLVRVLASRWGERKLLFIGLVCSGLALSGIALSYSVGPLVFFITLLGFAYSFFQPAFNGSLSLLSKKSEQGERMGLSQSISSLGRIVGSVLAGWLYSKYGMESPFLIGTLYTFIAIYIYKSIYLHLPGKKQ
ncbi:MAG: TCR/Tet family MFS transporter [Bdellovibrionaceae bacterium]|nr:TCR/Tet family MFS transporter [Pseudobdellovibrionaceae bacterium]